MSRVAVALSGGIDSAVTAALLKEEGHEVIGITAKMLCSDDFETIAQNAKKVADKLEIKHYIIDVSKEFSKNIVEYFENSYKNGLTPNPCIMCNKHIKWGVLFDYAINELGVDYIATGHYANIKKDAGVYKLFPASDEHKDQLYFLFLLSQDHLSKTLFPLSKYKKTEVKALAEKYDLPPKSAKESQDICFIKYPMTTKKYLNNIFTAQEGNFIENSTGKVLGKHNGFWQFTIGQRKGIGIAAPQPLYVTGINSQTNTVYIGFKEDLESTELFLNHVHWNYPMNLLNFEALIKIRYNMSAVKAEVSSMPEGIRIKFYEPISGITPGQACVIYDSKDGHLLGGGFIDIK